jgi:hypothetical protein
MRKSITTLFAVTALAVGAQPAAADDPAATTTARGHVGGVVVSCVTPDRVGVAGAFGAWGHYVDGCTVRRTCVDQVCSAAGDSQINTEANRGHAVTLNSRLRAFSASGNNIWFRDKSCAGTNVCTTFDLVHIRQGQSASVQCNGVRQSAFNRARVRCTLNLSKVS